MKHQTMNPTEVKSQLMMLTYNVTLIFFMSKLKRLLERLYLRFVITFLSIKCPIN